MIVAPSPGLQYLFETVTFQVGAFAPTLHGKICQSPQMAAARTFSIRMGFYIPAVAS